MGFAAEKEMSRIGSTHGMEDHDYDLVHVLDQKLEAVWRYDQYIENADGNPGLQTFWRECKEFDQRCVARLKELIHQEINKGCF